jgi:two-component system nitrogen regulation response regulator NtrX
MSLAAQAKVLRVLQEGIVTRIGGSKQIEVDVRVIAATNKNVEEEIAAGRFREDLYYRLNVVPIQVPTLRERLDDIPALVQHFSHLVAKTSGLPLKRFDEGAVRRFQQHGWPGNVRELRNAIERAVILAPGKTVTAADLDRMLGEPLPMEETPLPMERFTGSTFEGFKHEAEKSFLEAKLKEHDWNVSETARALKMPRSNLYKKIERYGLSRDAQ